MFSDRCSSLVFQHRLYELMGSLRTFEMNLEEEKGDQKSKGIALQVESHAEEMESVCDDDNDLIELITLKRTICRRPFLI